MTTYRVERTRAISIHALREESDYNNFFTDIQSIDFYPRSP